VKIGEADMRVCVLNGFDKSLIGIEIEEKNLRQLISEGAFW